VVDPGFSVRDLDYRGSGIFEETRIGSQYVTNAPKYG